VLRGVQLILADAPCARDRDRVSVQGMIDDSGARKDANEVLQKDGEFALRTFLESSPAYPIKGLYQYTDYRSKIWDAFDGLNETDKPVSTGWRVLDDFYRVVPGELTVVTGALQLAQHLSAYICCAQILSNRQVLVWVCTVVQLIRVLSLVTLQRPSGCVTSARAQASPTRASRSSSMR
jgi:hypothetical protein